MVRQWPGGMRWHALAFFPALKPISAYLLASRRQNSRKLDKMLYVAVVVHLPLDHSSAATSCRRMTLICFPLAAKCSESLQPAEMKYKEPSLFTTTKAEVDDGGLLPQVELSLQLCT